MIRRFASTSIPFVMLVLGMGTSECEGPPPGGCMVDGVAYEDGARGIPAPDGCNTCSCEDGALSCTEIACPPPSCVVDGVSYDEGATVPAGDGCNTCTCRDGTLAQCTDIACDACSVFGASYSGSAPAPDGCNSCSCEDGHVGAGCTEADCGPMPIEPCTAWSAFPSDAYELGAIAVDGDTLSVTVSYSGGCEPHYFRLCYDGFLESSPVQVELRLEHDGQNDACEAYPTETRHFDLTPLAETYREMYATEHDTVILRLGEGATYTF